MRRFAILLSLCALLLALVPGTAQAAPPTRVEEHAVVVECATTTEDGFLSMTVVMSDEFGSFGDLAFWEEGTEPFEEAPTRIAISSTVEGDANSLTATFELVEFDETQEPPFGDPAGTALLTVDLAPDGDPIAVDDRFRNGNRWETVTGTIQPLSLDGTLELPGADLESFEGCTAAAQTLTYFSTSPAAYVDRFREFVISCSWENGSETVGMSLYSNSFGAFADVYLFGPETDVFGATETTVTDTSFGFEVELVDSMTGEPVGTAEATGDFSPTGEFFRSVDRFGMERIKIRGEAYSVDGTLDVTIGGTTETYPIDDEHCQAADQVVSVHFVEPNGPKPKPLTNDEPSGAIELRLGRVTRIVTGANAPEAEAPCFADPESEDSDVPFGYTAWWTVTGTGDEMTVSTVGSSFDTVVAVYTLEGDVFEQVVCVDDVSGEESSLQAVATWESEAGVTYYIQAGGFADSTGRLELVVN